MATINRNTIAKRNLIDDGIDIETENSFSSKGIELLYFNDEMADIHFVFESSGDRIPAHKFILSVSSPVFKTIFFGVKLVGNEMKIDDDGVNVDAFKMFLGFFYLKKVKLSMEHIENVMLLCHKYKIDDCIEICSTFLMENLSIDKMCLCYRLATHYKQNNLKDHCLREISMNAEAVFKTKEFLECNWALLNEIVKLDTLLCRESVLLEACISWARNTCQRNNLDADDKRNIRNQLKGIIYEIRYTQITFQELAKCLHTNPYNEDEYKNIICLIGRQKVISNKFKNVPRFAPYTLECNRCNDPNADYKLPNIIATIFSSTQSLIFGQFEVYFKPFGQNVHCEISVEGIDSNTKIVEKFSKLISTNDKLTSLIVLPEPIFVEKDKKYKIQLNFSSNNIRLRGYVNMKEKVNLRNGSTITFHRDKSHGFDDVHKNAITWLNFNEINT